MRMTFPITQEWAEDFAREWIAAWNSHDLNRICSHYAADIEFTSPFVSSLTGNVDGTVISYCGFAGILSLSPRTVSRGRSNSF